ncbi:2-octaprenyl-3-methyl-6-methoxy-1,4-benzoquinol hydroxylase [Canicola haemoglobinophilus]|uniref:2-octaprenyl-3-methyl-6-methoxy-1,4-benzoquinol hydroxylase n=1 Tax=Canicola haemoglobinophilus TaxID=733 RepID=A0AB38H990_9PAST|nr:FAD-dependent monooxygenase [Canicola haemoglobinophilus]STO54147.1 2-octaprenyl-3-methyl-6-methoxy-1,4-benzoquinol hydroxylase [Canicola haemoglobinophilus]STO68680.1 2-octaprenyl-3-methyl-6-methoxy-1,4-benzoquinol hydroxylase [Canicola haemoglobinophilus]
MQKDIIVVGGGMIGAACASGLGSLGLQVHVIEHQALPLFDPTSDYDIRISAISATSVNLLKDLQAWQHIEKMRICPYRGLETWEIEGFATKFHSQDLQLPELGFMVENNLIQLGLWQTFSSFPNITTSIGNTITHVEKCGKNWRIFLSNGESYQAPLIIAADGANSQLRQIAGIGLTGWQYRQDCMLILVDTEQEQQDITWQQFYPTGPRALLPLLDKKACLVWYDSPQKIRELKQLTNEKLAKEIHQSFPQRLGNIKVQKAASFALTRRHAQDYFKQGIVLVGDAAHTINPLAGQGVNLGFKDVKVLLEVIKSAVQNNEDFSEDKVLQRYQNRRKPDNLLMQTGMDVFYKTFKEEILPLKIARNLALLSADKITPLKKQALKYALGL